MTKSPLKKGYTTGVHASFAFKSAWSIFLATQKKSISITNKMDNDDLDVTKGCEIVVTITQNLEELELNPIEHKPYILGNLRVYAGVGVGVVTKDGLKPPKGYPAINPTPLGSIEAIIGNSTLKKIVYASISVTNGEEIAKQTANSKVGVLGGISILGTTGWVKPISAEAYLDSIKTEIGFIKANGYAKVIFTLGSSSLEYAQSLYIKESIVEIGNFVYDSFDIADRLEIKEVVFVCGIGKAVKVAQGHKNTHNRFGSIDFKELKETIKEELKENIDIESTKTVKGIVSQLKDRDGFYNLIEQKAQIELKKWFKNIDIKVRIVR